MLTDEQIEFGKRDVNYSLTDAGLHEHNDCIRFAYEWLDAQTKLQRPSKNRLVFKGLIESWAGCYISVSDIDVAAYIHPERQGAYPFLNISRRLTRPLKSRIDGLSEVNVHNRQDSDDFKYP